MSTLSRILATEFTPKRQLPRPGELWKIIKAFSTTNNFWDAGEVVEIIRYGPKAVEVEKTPIKNWSLIPTKYFEMGYLKKEK